MSGFLGSLHPVAVHFPVALVALAAALEAWSLLARRRGRESPVGAVVPLLLALGGLGAILAAATGWMLGNAASLAGPVYERHRTLGTVLAASVLPAAIAGALARRGSRRARLVYLVLLAHCAFLLVGTGHLGGTLTHGEGWLTRRAPEGLRTVLARLSSGGATASLPPEQAVAFTALVRPILARRCTDCHGPTAARGGLRLDTEEAIGRGGEHGAVIAPGRPESSELLRRIWLPAAHPKAMPGGGLDPVSASEGALLRWWIGTGASFDAKVGELDLPPDARVAVEAALGPLAPPGPTLPAAAVETADPKVVEALRALGFSVRPVALDQPFLDVRAAPGVDDAALARLEPLSAQVVWLDLSGSAIGDRGAAVLARLPHLVRLDLGRTETGDAALAHLAGLGHLESLNLHATRVGDAGIGSLEQLPKLRSVYLWGSAVTAAGVERLRAARPALQVDAGDSEPGTAPTPTP